MELPGNRRAYYLHEKQELEQLLPGDLVHVAVDTLLSPVLMAYAGSQESSAHHQRPGFVEIPEDYSPGYRGHLFVWHISQSALHVKEGALVMSGDHRSVEVYSHPGTLHNSYIDLIDGHSNQK